MVCDFKSKSSGGLNYHTESIHKNEKPHKCELCDTKFTRKSDLRNHTLRVHEKRSPLSVSFVMPSLQE